MNPETITKAMLVASAAIGLCIPVVLGLKAMEASPSMAASAPVPRIEVVAPPAFDVADAGVERPVVDMGELGGRLLSETFAGLDAARAKGRSRTLVALAPAAPPVSPARSSALAAIETAVPQQDAPVPKIPSEGLAYARAEAPIQVPEPDGASLECLAQAIYFEARGEPDTGRLAVAQVVMNRTRDDAFPSSVCGVVHQANKRGCQFSFTCDGLPETIRDRKSWRAARKLASDVLLGRRSASKLVKALHYHSTAVTPGWADGKVVLQTIGRHVFYRG